MNTKKRPAIHGHWTFSIPRRELNMIFISDFIQSHFNTFTSIFGGN